MTKSYASVDRIEGNYCVCEVELVEVENSFAIDFCDKDTAMMDVSLEQIVATVGEVQEGDIIVVGHDNENVTHIYCKDEEEKSRRIEILKQLQA